MEGAGEERANGGRRIREGASRCGDFLLELSGPSGGRRLSRQTPARGPRPGGAIFRAEGSRRKGAPPKAALPWQGLVAPGGAGLRRADTGPGPRVLPAPLRGCRKPPPPPPLPQLLSPAAPSKMRPEGLRHRLLTWRARW